MPSRRLLNPRFGTARDDAGGDDTRRSRGGGGGGTDVRVLKRRLRRETRGAARELRKDAAAAAAERERLAATAAAGRAARAREGRAFLEAQEHTWQQQVKKTRKGLPNKW